MIDALVVGAGPAGLMAAQVMAERGLNVVVADAKPSPARKFLMAGKSGLNLTMDQPLGAFVDVYHNSNFTPMIQAFGPEQVIDLAASLGQKTFTGSSRRVFPTVMKASPMLRAWMAKLDGLGVQLHRNWRWLGLDNQFQTPDGVQQIDAKVTILAMGGGSWARLGSNGLWADTLSDAGIPVQPFQPSNMGVHVLWSEHMKSFFGQPLKSIRLSSGMYSVKGEMVLTARGIEGSAIYSMSPEIRAGDVIKVDLTPDLTLEVLTKRLAKPRGKNSLSNHLRKSLKLPDIKRAVLREWGGALPNEASKLAHLIKALPLPALTPFPIDEAISTAGGLSFDALTKALMIKSHPGVFCAGEMLDWDAPTGGYLITACLATGAWAGRHAADYALDVAAI
ncbi:MAG: TIGR03862 family flavoprotein [Planktomarina sp.]